MIRILEGDCRDVLRTLRDGSVQCCVTSPPYFGLRDYGTARWEGGEAECDHVIGTHRTGMGLEELSKRYRGGGKKHAGVGNITARGQCPRCGAIRIDKQIGVEPSPAEYIAALVSIFREVKRVLRDDGTLWINIGDSYCTIPHGRRGENASDPKYGEGRHRAEQRGNRNVLPGIKHKDLIGIPWLLAFALRDDGWYLRAESIWHKPNPMPESIDDRPTKAHEQVFLFSKKPQYFYDHVAVQEAGSVPAGTRAAKGSNVRSELKNVNGRPPEYWEYTGKRNLRSVWTIATKPYAEAHFATFPPELAEICIKAGSREGDLVLDPFGGAGTTGLVADRLRRGAICIELNPAYAAMARRRIVSDGGMFTNVE